MLSYEEAYTLCSKICANHLSCSTCPLIMYKEGIGRCRQINAERFNPLAVARKMMKNYTVSPLYTQEVAEIFSEGFQVVE